MAICIEEVRNNLSFVNSTFFSFSCERGHSFLCDENDLHRRIWFLGGRNKQADMTPVLGSSFQSYGIFFLKCSCVKSWL